MPFTRHTGARMRALLLALCALALAAFVASPAAMAAAPDNDGVDAAHAIGAFPYTDSVDATEATAASDPTQQAIFDALVREASGH